jgi:hypothetical protein
VLAGLLRSLWKRTPPGGHPFSALQEMCDQWANSSEIDLDIDGRGVDLGLARVGIEALRALPGTADQSVLLCTDLHAETCCPRSASHGS